jgi:serine protease Do
VFSGLIQTDAAINPGNSGGALLDINGRLIGINTAIKPGAEGIGFAIRVNDVRRILKDLLSVEKTKDLWLGLQVEEGGNGTVSVAAVERNSPASEAGILKGSVITGLNGVPVKGSFDFHKKLIEAAEQSTDVTLTVDGKDRNVTLKKYGETVVAARCGFKGKMLTRWMARRLKISVMTPGVLITGVYDDSPAGDIGLKPGDVVVSIDDTRVSTVQDIAAALENVAAGKEISIIAVRSNRILQGRIKVK